MYYYDRALRVEPASREALRDRILAIERMGAPQAARTLADAKPGLLSSAEYRRVEQVVEWQNARSLVMIHAADGKLIAGVPKPAAIDRAAGD